MITAYRRNKNLNDILVHTALKPDKQVATRNTPFTKIRYLENPLTGAGSLIQQSLTCETRNLIYAIQCKISSKIYIGETGNSLQTRMYQHMYHLRKQNKSTVLYNHFKEYDISALIYMALDSKKEWSKTQRRQQERKWISRLQTMDPSGLNETM